MQARYIPAIVMLIAGAITSIISIVRGYELLYNLKVLLAVLVVFYIIGIIAKSIIVKGLENKNSRNNLSIADDSIDKDELQSNE